MVEREAREPETGINPEGRPTATGPEPVAPAGEPGTPEPTGTPSTMGGPTGQPQQGGGGGGAQHKGTVDDARRAFRHGTPDDVREEFRMLVEKGVSAVAGAMKGFVDTMRREDVSGQARETIKQTGDTTRDLSRTVAEEGKKVMHQGRQVAHSIGQEGRRTARTVGEEGRKVAEQGREAAGRVREGTQGNQGTQNNP